MGGKRRHAGQRALEGGCGWHAATEGRGRRWAGRRNEVRGEGAAVCVWVHGQGGRRGRWWRRDGWVASKHAI